MRKTRLRALREDNDLKQKNIADLLGCSQVCYSYYEIGRREIPIDLLIKLADYYNTSIDYLLFRTDDKAPYPPSTIFNIINTTKNLPDD